MSYTVWLEPRAVADIHQAISYYNSQQHGLGNKFESALDKHITTLSKSPLFQIRYDGVRCLPMQKFPFMIHFVVDKKVKEVFVISVFHTSKNPDDWQLL